VEDASAAITLAEAVVATETERRERIAPCHPLPETSGLDEDGGKTEGDTALMSEETSANRPWHN
jgi:hypothetical protein